MMELWKWQIVHDSLQLSLCFDQCRIEISNRFHIGLRVGTHESLLFRSVPTPCLEPSVAASLASELPPALHGYASRLLERRIPGTQRIEENTLGKRH